MFGAVEELKRHKNVLKADVCEMARGVAPEGVTAEHVEVLRSKAKRYPGQGDESRWYDIYQLLFPEAPLPSSPCESSLREPAMKTDKNQILSSR